DVDAAARIRVVTPHAADVVAALEDRDVVEPGFLELDGGADAREAGADDGDAWGDVRLGSGLRHFGTAAYHAMVPCGTMQGGSSAPTTPTDATNDARVRLVTGMLEAVEARGFAGTTIADVARHARVSKRTFYEHFDSKEACFLAAYVAASDEMLKA